MAAHQILDLFFDRKPFTSDDYPFLKEIKNHLSKTYKPPTPQLNSCILAKQSLLKQAGPDPLDCIVIYRNETEQNVAHWHYVGFGLSDLYNHSARFEQDSFYRNKQNEAFQDATKTFAKDYAKTFPKPVQQLYPQANLHGDKINGFGFELTFRIKCQTDETNPPEWPAQIMQELAKFVFESKIVFNAGDKARLDDQTFNEESIIRHVIMVEDPQLGQAVTSQGSVRFIQIVGVTEQELEAARRWGVETVASILSESPETGGLLLVTDMSRKASLQFDPEELKLGGFFKKSYSTAIVCEDHLYSARGPWLTMDGVRLSNESGQVSEGGCNNNNKYDGATNFRAASRMSNKNDIDTLMLDDDAGSDEKRYHDDIYLLLNLRAARYLRIALEGRLANNEPFSIQNPRGNLLTTFVPEHINCPSLVSHETPRVWCQSWLQILITDQLRELMLESIEKDFSEAGPTASLKLPKEYFWSEHRLHMTIVEEIDMDKLLR